MLKLTPEQLGVLGKYHFLGEPDLADNEFISRCKYAVSVGYPASKNKRFHDRNVLRKQIFSYSTVDVAVAQGRVQVPFLKNGNIDALTDAIVSAPDPYGLSGGPMFGVEINEDTIRGHARPRLIGILIEWHEAQEKIFATPLSAVLAVIRDAYAIQLPDRLAQPFIRIRPSPYAPGP